MGKDNKHPPTVYVIAGPNGAGKTTFATDLLPDFVHCREFLNADLIAAGLAPFAPETQNLRAGRLLLERIEELADERADFGFETTLSGRSYLKILRDMKTRCYRVWLYFLWLPNADMAVARVANRVKQGGHSVPADDIRRRYLSGVRNLFQLYHPISDGWWLYDASLFPLRLIASGELGRRTVVQESLYQQIKNRRREYDEERA